MKRHLKTLAVTAIALGGVNVAYSADCIQPVTDFDNNSYSVVYTAFGDPQYCVDSGTVTGDLALADPGPDGLDDYGEDYRWPVQRQTDQTGGKDDLSVSQADNPRP